MFAVFKVGGILLFAPAFFYFFREIPQWIGRIFPTYYLVEPVVRISQEGAGWTDIAAHVFALLAIDVLLAAAVALAMKRMMRLTA